jgi:uncharacterized membrane protein
VGLTDRLYNFLLRDRTSPENLLEEYSAKNIKNIKEGRDPINFYPPEVYEYFLMEQLPTPTARLSSFGERLLGFQIPPFEFNYIFRQVAARSIQVFTFIGLIILLIQNSKQNTNKMTEYSIAVAVSILIMGLFLIIPFLSAAYGTQRLFQQLFLVLAFPFVFGVYRLFTFLLKPYAWGMVLSTILLFFFSFAGVIPQLTGGYYPHLHLNNNGIDYGAYYTHTEEVASMRWMAAHYDNEIDVYSSSSTRSKIAANVGVFSYHSLLPSVIRRDAYVYVNAYIIETGNNIASHNGDLFVFSYPLGFLNQQKDLIYSNNKSRIYK